MKGITCIDHPVVKHKLGILRNKNTSPREFRLTMAELTRLITYEAAKEELKMVNIETPLCASQVEEISNPPVRFYYACR